MFLVVARPTSCIKFTMLISLSVNEITSTHYMLGKKKSLHIYLYLGYNRIIHTHSYRSMIERQRKDIPASLAHL